MSLAQSCLMARTGPPSSWVAAMVTVMPLRKGSILDTGIVSSMWLSLHATCMLVFVRNNLEKDGPSCLSDSMYVNSPTARKAAKGREKAARRVTLS